MAEPSFKVKERPDFLKLKQAETWKSESSGAMPRNSGVVQFSVDEYNKPVDRKKLRENNTAKH